jgi:hypothetical protein
MKVFVQGDRDAHGCENASRAIALKMAKCGIEVNLGAYGKLVEIFLAAGCPAHCHGHRSGDRGKAFGKGASYADCTLIAKLAGYPDTREVAWGLRLGVLMANSDAFLFFSGREGTVAHLVPILAFACKLWKNKKIALVGWEPEKISALAVLMGRLPENVRIFGADPTPQAVVDFLAG